MQITRKAKLIGLISIAVAVILVLILCLATCGGDKKITDPAKFEGDHGVYVTGNGAYDVTGKVSLRLVNERDNGWKQFVFKIDSSAAVDDLYILPLKSGVYADEIILSDGGIDATLQSQFAKNVLKADFDKLETLDKTYGFQKSDAALSDKGECIFAEDTASKILYFVKNGEVKEITAESDLSSECDGYGLSIWVKYEWSGTDYDNLFYIGFNEVETETNAG